MSKIISISISEKLNEKIKIKKNKFKISQVCQDALLKAVNEDDRILDGDLNGCIERLRNEKMKFLTPIYNEGHNDGFKDACKITLDDFVEIKSDFKDLKKIDKIQKSDVFEFFSSGDSEDKYYALYDPSSTYFEGEKYEDKSGFDCFLILVLESLIGVNEISEEEELNNNQLTNENKKDISLKKHQDLPNIQKIQTNIPILNSKKGITLPKKYQKFLPDYDSSTKNKFSEYQKLLAENGFDKNFIEKSNDLIYQSEGKNIDWFSESYFSGWWSGFYEAYSKIKKEI